MKKVITALGNPYLNEELNKTKNFEILAKDIQYQDGIFEVLEKYKEIDFLIISEILPGEKQIEKLIGRIKYKNNKIKIVLILEKENKELENKLYLEGVNKIYYNNIVEVEEIKLFIQNDENNKNSEIEKMKTEIEKLKDILINNNIEIDNKKIKAKINKPIKEKLNAEGKIEDNKKVISISGTGGVGKSIITINLANIFKEKNQKVLIIDFDILNNSLHTILGVNNYSKKVKQKLQKNDLIKNKINIKELIIKINKKVDLISGINLIFDSKYKISSEKIKAILDELKDYYDVIIIDTSSECFFNYCKNVLLNSDIILFLIEANILEIKKANNLLKIYTNEWKIRKEKIKMIINKYTNETIDDAIIKSIFSEYKVLGKIGLNKKYNILVNNKCEEGLFTKDIKKEYEIISDKIIKLENKKLKLTIENLYNRLKYNFSKTYSKK